MAPAHVDLYVLRCPDSGAIRYAGKATCAKERFKRHLREAPRHSRRVNLWIRSLLKARKIPVLEVLQRVPLEEWEAGEVALIKRLRDEGCDLLNMADGGAGPWQSVDQRRLAGPRAVALRERTPKAREMWLLKKRMGSCLRYLKENNPPKYQAVVAKLREAGRLRPDFFGAYVTL